VNFPALADPDRTRFCCLRMRRLKEALKDARAIAAVAAELNADGATLPRVEARVDELRGAAGSFWDGVEPAEVLAAVLFKARARAPEVVDAYFRPVATLQELSKPLTEWLHLAGLTAQPGGVPRTGRANLIGHRGGGMIASPRAVGIEAVDDPATIAASLADRAIDNTHAAYLACTPAAAAGFLWLHATSADRWDAEALQRGLQPSGRGLLIVEGDAIAQAIPPKERKPEKALLQQLAVDLQAGRRP
jgi:hypothetical protein